MYPAVELGKFLVPDGAGGLLQVRYEPEPLPVAVRGALNPWAVEQQRALRMQEDQAWQTIQTQTRQVNDTRAQIDAEIATYNATLGKLEHHLDQHIGGQITAALPLPGVAPITSTAQLAMSIVFPPFLLPGFDFIGKLIGGVFGIGKKAKPVMAYVNMLIGMLQASQIRIQQLIGLYGQQIDQLRQTVQVSLGIRAALAAAQEADKQASAAAISARESSQTQQAQVEAQRNRMMAIQHPRTRQGGTDAL